MNLEEIRSKLRTGHTIDEVCQEYTITFKELVDYMFELGAEKGYKFHRKHDGREGGYKRSGHLYISERDGKYFIRHAGNWFGTYKSLEDAILIRDWFITHRWDKRWVNRACEETGVVRCTK